MTIKRIKNICIALCLILLLGAVSVVPAQAASLSVSVGQSRVSVGNEFSVTIRVSDDVAAWTYQVTYSSNLTLVSGKTMPDGSDDEGSPHINTLLFRANSEGTGTITASCTNGLSDGNRDYSSSDSASVTIISASSDDGGEPPYHGGGGGSGGGTTAPSKSSNNALASLTVSAGELAPAFDPTITDYTLSLPLRTNQITFTATPSDSKATVQGDGEVALRGGENKVAVVVTAEDGSAKTYNITVKVAREPTVFFSLNGESLGVMQDTDGVTPPAGFSPTTVPYSGEELPAWTNAAGQMLLYLVNQDTLAAGFYLYDEAEGVQSPYLPIVCGATTYVYTGVPAEKESIPGLTLCDVEAFGHILKGWKYRDASLQDFCVLYLMDAGGNYGCHTYDSQSGTLQRFSGAVFTDDGRTMRVPMLYVYIAGGAAAVLLLLVIILAAVCISRGKKLRLPATEVPVEAPAAPGEQPPAETPAAEEMPTPGEPEQPAEEAPSQPEPQRPEENSPAEPGDEPAVPEDEPTPEDPAEEAAAEPAEKPEPADSPAEETPQPPAPEQSLEDTLRRLPLDKLLRDIHDL